MKKGILLPVLAIVIMAGLVLGLTLGINGLAVKNAQAEHLKVMQTLLPGSKEFTVEPYDGEDANIRSVHKGENGYVIETVTRGYAGDITMLIGVSSEGKVTGLTIRDMSETPGIGMSAMWDWDFLGQFLGLEGGIAIGTAGEDAFSGATGTVEESTGEATEVDALTGATVTSKAIVRSVNSAVAFVTGSDVSSGATSWGG